MEAQAQGKAAPRQVRRMQVSGNLQGRLKGKGHRGL